jgi:hypothetical protein
MKLIGSTIIAFVAAQTADQDIVDQILSGLGGLQGEESVEGLGRSFGEFDSAAFGRLGVGDLFAGGSAAAQAFQAQLDVKLPGLQLEDFIVNGQFDTAGFQSAARDKIIEMQAIEAASQFAANAVSTGRERPAGNANRPTGNNLQIGEKYFSRTTTSVPTTSPTTTTDYDLPECWHCDASTFAECASGGYYKACQSGDYDCCFLELREVSDNLKQLCTGCKSHQACYDLKYQNFVFSDNYPTGKITHEMPLDQCRPVHNRLQSRGRFRRNPSVCRTCFNLCDKDEAEGSYCFGGIRNTGVDFEGRDWLTNTVPTFGIPTWRIFDDTADAAGITTFTANAPGNDFETWYFADAGTGKTHPAGGINGNREAEEMSYWRVQNQPKTWWESDLKFFQNQNKAAFPHGTV